MAHRRLAHEARAVRHQFAQCYRRAKWIVGREVRQIPGERRIQAEHALLDELHHGDIGEELRHAAHAINGIRRSRRAVGEIRVAEALRPDDALIVDESDGDRGEMLLALFVRDELLERVVGWTRRRPQRGTLRNTTGRTLNDRGEGLRESDAEYERGEESHQGAISKRSEAQWRATWCPARNGS